MDKKVFQEIVKNLEGLNYFFFSGIAIEIYTNGKRKAKDLDIVIHEKDAETFAKKINSKIRHRVMSKDTFSIDDYGFETKFKNQEIEVTTGFPKKRMEDNTFEKLFKRKLKKKYRGVSIFLVPIEELIAHKAWMHREKDKEDLKRLVDTKIDLKFLKEIAKDWGAEKEIITLLKGVGYRV